jgi:pimeloyl-ACP methyl ester carboxylesterase
VNMRDIKALETMQAAYLDRVVPGYRLKRVTWSGGTTQVIEAGAGPALLLIHGGLGEAFQWAPLMPILSRSYRVLAVDRPGHGLADPFDYRDVELLAFGARFVAEILDSLQLSSVPLVGNSMGGLWATGCALEHPERVSHLFLVGSPAGVQRGVPFQLRLATVPIVRSIVRAGMARPSREGVRAFWKLLVAHPERLDNDFLDLSAASQMRNHPSWLSMLDVAVDARGIKPHLLLQRRWGDLKVPTTLIWGVKDAFSPIETGETMTSSHPGIRMVRIPDAGHAPWFDDANSVAQALVSELGKGRKVADDR